jgi:SAM-dependent methyltransferase
MTPAAYLEMAETEALHWWFCGRRAVLTRMLQTMQLPAAANILELGCGTGGNLEMLAHFGTVQGLEMDDTARDIALQKTGSRFTIKAGHCPDQVPFAPGQFDLVCMFDVLEHIDNDTETLVVTRSLLKPGGKLLITVPAYQWLFGSHDEFLHHKRRYNAGNLRGKISTAGLVARRLSYFNTLLFPLAALARLKDKMLGSDSPTGTEIPPAAINKLFQAIFSFERMLLPKLNLPFGVSLLCILESADGS